MSKRKIHQEEKVEYMHKEPFIYNEPFTAKEIEDHYKKYGKALKKTEIETIRNALRITYEICYYGLKTQIEKASKKNTSENEEQSNI